jgi:hypothetical protein
MTIGLGAAKTCGQRPRSSSRPEAAKKSPAWIVASAPWTSSRQRWGSRRCPFGMWVSARTAIVAGTARA